MSTATEAKEKLAADFRAVMDDIDALTRATGKETEGEIKALRTRIRSRLDDAKERLADVQHQTVERAKAAATATDDYVHAKPWQAIGAAAAIGLALGVLVGRR